MKESTFVSCWPMCPCPPCAPMLPCAFMQDKATADRAAWAAWLAQYGARLVREEAAGKS